LVSNQADTDPFNFDNIAKQRNLNDKGKALAKALGDAKGWPLDPRHPVYSRGR
jgi:hypothetical protein